MHWLGREKNMIQSFKQWAEFYLSFSLFGDQMETKVENSRDLKTSILVATMGKEKKQDSYCSCILSGSVYGSGPIYSQTQIQKGQNNVQVGRN